MQEARRASASCERFEKGMPGTKKNKIWFIKQNVHLQGHNDRVHGMFVASNAPKN